MFNHLKQSSNALQLVEIILSVYCCYIIYVFGTKLAFHIENGFMGSCVYYIFFVPLNHKHLQTVQTLHHICQSIIHTYHHIIIIIIIITQA